MPLDTQQLLKETAESPHATQLNRGFAWLRFRPPLERDYLQHMRDAMEAQYLIAAFMGIFAWSLFTFVDMVRFDVWDSFPHLSTLAMQVLALRLSSMLLLISALFALRVQRLRPYRPAIAASVLLIMSVSGAVMIALCKQAGLPQGDSALLLMIVCCFLPLGLTFYQSLGLSLFICLCTWLLGMAILSGEQAKDYIRLMEMLLLAVMVGAVGSYLREHAQREQYLLRQLLSWQATRDALTQLSNRRHFNSHILTVLNQAERDQKPLALVLIDVDRFKAYNDRYGHQQGDQALQQVAQCLNRHSRRPLDLAARLGGEEFALVLYDIGFEPLKERLEHLQQDLRQHAIEHSANPDNPYLTLSMGAAIAHPAETPDQLLARADSLLYQAKNSGRDRFFLAGLGTA